VSRRNLRRLLTEATEDLAELVRDDYDGQTDEQIADLVIEIADAAMPLGYVPGAGPVLEALDGLVLRLFRGRVLRMVKAARARLNAAAGAH
jgi:hypothetical protein